MRYPKFKIGIAGVVALAGGVRSMDEHFAELFTTYRARALGHSPREAALAL